MPLGDFTPEGTEQSRLLCEEVSRRSDGICIFAFSRGKDALGAWIWLRQFFHTIHVFHAAPIPHLSFVDRSLAYYEKEFQTKIHRFFDGESSMGLSLLWWQTPDKLESVRSLNREAYGLEEMAEVLRKKFDCPQAYMAMAMSMNDNMFRRMNLKKLDENGNLTYQGAFKNGFNTFYPTFDWTIDKTLEAISKNGLCLPDDYLLEPRNLSLLNAKNIERFMELFPEDVPRAEAMFPLIKSIWARQQFRRMKISGNGVLPKTVSDVIGEIKLLQLEKKT